LRLSMWLMVRPAWPPPTISVSTCSTAIAAVLEWLSPRSSGHPAHYRFPEATVYVNALEDGTERDRRARRPNYTRLAALEEQYDPTNILSSNQNIATEKTRGLSAVVTNSPPGRPSRRRRPSGSGPR